MRTSSSLSSPLFTLLLGLATAVFFGCQKTPEGFQAHPDNQIDVGLTALTLAKEIYTQIDVDDYNARLDDIADQVRRLAAGSTDPDYRVRVLNTVIHQREGFHSDRDVSVLRHADHYYLNRLLDTKKGNCFSMPLLYVSVAQRLGWPVYMVHAPDHVFVRYVDPALKEQNIETTSGGGYIPDERYIRDLRASERGLAQGTYMRTLTHKEAIAELYEKNAVTLARQGRSRERIIELLQTAVDLNPRLVGAWANLKASYLRKARMSPHERPILTSLADRCQKKLDDLGFVHPKDVPLYQPVRRPDHES